MSPRHVCAGSCASPIDAMSAPHVLGICMSLSNNIEPPMLLLRAGLEISEYEVVGNVGNPFFSGQVFDAKLPGGFGIVDVSRRLSRAVAADRDREIRVLASSNVSRFLKVKCSVFEREATVRLLGDVT